MDDWSCGGAGGAGGVRGGIFGVGVESNYMKIKSFIARLVKNLLISTPAQRGRPKGYFLSVLQLEKAPKKKKRREHKDNPAGRCRSAGLSVDSVEAHSQFPLAAGRLDGCQA